AAANRVISLFGDKDRQFLSADRPIQIHSQKPSPMFRLASGGGWLLAPETQFPARPLSLHCSQGNLALDIDQRQAPLAHHSRIHPDRSTSATSSYVCGPNARFSRGFCLPTCSCSPGKKDCHNGHHASTGHSHLIIIVGCELQQRRWPSRPTLSLLLCDSLHVRYVSSGLSQHVMQVISDADERKPFLQEFPDAPRPEEEQA